MAIANLMPYLCAKGEPNKDLRLILGYVCDLLQDALRSNLIVDLPIGKLDSYPTTDVVKIMQLAVEDAIMEKEGDYPPEHYKILGKALGLINIYLRASLEVQKMFEEMRLLPLERELFDILQANLDLDNACPKAILIQTLNLSTENDLYLVISGIRRAILEKVFPDGYYYAINADRLGYTLVRSKVPFEG